MAPIADSDVSINAAGDIRWTGAATTNTHTVLEFIQWLMDKQDDAVAAGDDLLDITVDTPFDRSTDQIVTLNSPFNIDDTFATHLYDGSVSQTNQVVANGGEDLYSGLAVIGPVETDTEYMILQNGEVLPAFWGTGINPEAAPSLVFSRHLVKSKVAGAQIDGQRITVLARELGDQYRRFPVTLGTGNSVAAIGNGADIFNTTIDATLAGYDGTIINTEGFQELNIDGTGAAGQEFYSQWDPDTQSVNDTYEFTKFISQRSHVADTTGGTPTGTDFVIDDATTTGQAQSFIPLAVTEKLTEARFNIKIGGGNLADQTGTLYCLLYDSDDAAAQLAEPTGAILARSQPVLASQITTTYEEVIFRFDRFDPSDGTDQSAGLDLTNAEYFIALHHDEGDATNFMHVQGANTDQDSTMNQAAFAAASWTAVATNDLGLTVKSSPSIHGIPGEQMQGINIEVGYDGEAGTGLAEDDIAFWGTKVFYDTLAGGPFFAGEQVTFRENGTLVFKVGGEVLFDDGVSQLVVALDAPSAAVIDDDDVIEGITSGATAAINVAGGAIEDESLGGGTGLVLAIDDNTGTGEVYLQVLSGVNPVENNRLRSPGTPLADYVDATAVLNTRTVNPEFVGTSTGSNIIGSYGIGFDPLEVGSSDLFTALDNTTSQPPNNVVFTVSGLVAGEDRVLVGPRTGTALDRGQWLVSTGLTVVNETALVVKTGTDTVPFPDNEENWPDTGTGTDVSRLRIERDDGIYQRIPYDSHDGTDTFTLGTPITTAQQIDVVASAGTFTRAAGDFLAEGWEQGARFTGSQFTNGGNNADFTVDTVTATVITVVDNTGMVDESGGSDEILTGIGWDFSDATDGTGPSGWDSSQAAVNQNAFMAWIDILATATTATFTGVHVTANDRDLFVRVRDGGTAGDGIPTKTFQSTAAQFLGTPQTIAATRTDDA